MLTRYWFASARGLGVGVTAYSPADAEELLRNVGLQPGTDFDPDRCVTGVDIRSLDQGHVIPNMGPPNVRGVWFPCRNI